MSTKFIFLLLLSSISFQCFKAEPDEIIITKSFFNEVRNYKLGDDSKIRNLLEMTNKESDSLVFKTLIPAAHNDIILNKDFKFTFSKYSKINRKYQTIVFDSKEKEAKIAVIEYEKKPYMFILIKNSKIVSFVTLNKGDTKYFMLL